VTLVHYNKIDDKFKEIFISKITYYILIIQYNNINSYHSELELKNIKIKEEIKKRNWRNKKKLVSFDI